MSDAIETQGFKLEIGNADSPLTFTEVKEIKTFNAFDGEAAEIDVTHLQSAAKEFRMGLQDWGNFNLDLNYLPEDPGQMACRAAKGSRQVQQFKATFSDGSFTTFDAFVKNSPRSGGVDAVVETSFSLRVTGDIVDTPAP